MSKPNHSEPSDTVPASSWMTAAEVISWIAYRKIYPVEKWSELTRRDELFQRWGIFPADHLLAALEAMTAGRRLEPGTGPGNRSQFDPDCYNARAEQLMVERGLPSATLADELRADIAAYERANASLENAKREMNDATVEGRLVAYPADGITHIDEAGRVRPDVPPDLLAWTGAGADGSRLVLFRSTEVLRLWPAPAAVPLRKLPRVAVGGLRAWYRSRTEGWPPDISPPTAAEDWEAAKAAFPGRSVTRKLVRDLRSDHAPEAWRAHGRRKQAPGAARRDS